MFAPMADFIAVGGNRHPEAADWDSLTGLVAYGAGENIAIWRPSVHRLAGSGKSVCLQL